MQRLLVWVVLAYVARAQVNQPIFKPVGPPPNQLGPRPVPFVPRTPPREPTIADKIVKDPNLTEMVGFLRRVDLLKSLNATSFVSTVFLPDNNAIAAALIPSASLDLLRFVEYHYVAGNITSDKMLANGHKWTLNGTYFNGSSVWFHVKAQPMGKKQYCVNGAHVVSPDNMASNGVYHVIDRVLKPIGSLKSIGEYLKTEPGFQRMSSLLRDTRTASLDRQLGNETIVWTVFAPTDVAIPANALLARNPLDVLSRHVVRGRVLFDSSLGDMASVPAVKGNIVIINEANKVYVQNGAGERAEIVQFNQPTENGVIHRISDVMGYAWRTLMQSVDLHDTLTTLKRHLSKASLTTELNRRDVNYTLFAPTNQAFESFLRNKQFTQEQLTRLVKCHIADQRVTSLDVGNVANDVIVSTLAADEITISRTAPNTDIVVVYRGHRAKVVVADIATSNGVMHIIDRVFDGSTSAARSLHSLAAITTALVATLAPIALVAL